MADINGTAFADLLFGASAADVISGGDGRDVLYGGAGDDHLLGGEGDDILAGESGSDLLEGGGGNDELSSTDQGSDTLLGGEGNDVLFVDRTRAGDSLALDGGAGNDRLVVQLTAAATVTAAGGDGDDAVEIFALRSGLNLSLGAGRDLVTPVGLRTSVQGGGRIVISDFQAGAAGDRISFSSLSTADFTGWNLNSNPFAAGYLKAVQSGSDVVISASFTANGTFVDAITLQNVLLTGLTADNLGGWTWDGSAVPAQTLTGSGAAETLRGNGGADEMFGLDGDDILEGHAGADTLWGGEGNDILRGGQGADQVHGGAGNDTLTAETAGDALYGEDGDDRLTLSVGTGTPAGTLVGSGGAGNDTIIVSASSATASFTVDAGAGQDVVAINSLANSAVVTLGDGRDRLDIELWTKLASNTATIEVMDFATGDGGDRLDWAGFLLRSLSLGDNPFEYGFARLLQNGADVLLQVDRDGGGDQYATFITFRNTSAAAFTAYNLGGFATDGSEAVGTIVNGTADPDILFGTDGDDILQGEDGKDSLFGFSGDDEIHGGAGDDTINGGAGDDAIDGGAGNDVINPGSGEDLVDGGEGNDQYIDTASFNFGNKGFIGGAGDDSVSWFRSSSSGDILVASGGDGSDFFQVQNTNSFGRFFLDGGAGDDVFDLQGQGEVTLGAGVDLVRFTDAPFNADFSSTIVIQDFAVGDLGDRLSFAGLVARFTNFTPTANPFTSGYLKLVQNGPGLMIYADVDGPTGPTQDRLVAILAGVQKHSLTSHNIGGYGLPFIFGTAAGETFQGTVLDDDFIGGGGNDTFLVGYGGKDFATGGPGNDLFYVATVNSGAAPSVTIAGGGGSDTLQVQGKTADMYVGLAAATFSGLPGTPIIATGIGTVQLLSGFDASRGWALNSALSYNLQIADGFAPTGAPLIVDTTQLAASERLTIGAGWLNDADAFLKLVGGAGIESVHAGAGGSYLDGGAGDDELYAGLSSDTLIGGSGSDLLVVNDYFGTSTGTDILDGGEGNDRVQLFAMSGTATITLGAGSDTIEFPSSVYDPISGVINRNVTITDFAAGAGGDVLDWNIPLFHYLSGSYSNPFESGHARLIQDGSDVLLQLSRANNGNYLTLFRLQNHVVADFAGGIGGYVPVLGISDDVLTGTPGDDSLNGGAGNDILDGGAGSDSMTGGTGNDIFYVDNAGDQVFEAAGEGTDEVRTSLDSYSLLGSNVEKLTATTNGPHDLRGSAGDNVVTGAGGNDLLRLNDGGNDSAFGGAGSDVLYFGAAFTGSDVADGGADRDVVVLQGNYVDFLRPWSLVGVESLSLQSGSRTVWGDLANNFYDYTITTDDANAAAGQQLIVNGQTLRAGEDFTFDGSAETDGYFLVYGGHGVDILKGGAGNDAFFFEGARFGSNDRVDGGAGRDALIISAGNGVTHIEFGAASLTSIESISLNARYATDPTARPSYELILNNANVATGGNLIVNGNSLGDRVQTVLVDGSAVHDGTLTLIGGFGNDTLTGGSGGDLIQGGEGIDVLTGGGGADVFRYAGQYDATSQVPDRIADFLSGTDKIDLSRIDADSFAAGNQAFHWIGSGAFTGTGAASAGELRAYEYQGSWFVEGDMDGNGAADLVIQLTTPAAPIVQGDFLL